MAKQQLITTGLNGLVGSKFANDFGNVYDFKNLDLRDEQQPVDITSYQSVLTAFEQAPEAKFVFHLAAFTDVTRAWQEKGKKDGLVYQVNVVGTQNIVRACQATHKHLIHISTAYVFNGEKTGLYLETDPMKPIEWYGQTKALAEEAVMQSNINWTILRIDQPFRSDNFEKLDIAHRIMAGLNNNNLPPMFNNHYFGPTYIDDFAKVVDFIIRTGHTGIFHASSGEQWTDYDFANLIREKMMEGGNDEKQLPEIKAGNLNDYLKTLNRPYQKNTAMNCNKLQRIIDFKMKSVEEAVEEVEV